MSKRTGRERLREKRRQEQVCLKAYLPEILQDVNFRMLCHFLELPSAGENLLWVEELTLEDIRYPQQKRFSLKAFFCFLRRLFKPVGRTNHKTI